MTDRPVIARSVPLIDLEVGGGDGRTVTAYAATFDDAYEVTDQFGHYLEQINRTAFNRQLGLGISRIMPLFNHGLTPYGTPSDEFSKPLGQVLSVKAEKKGLLTVTRFGTTPWNEEVLTMLKDGTVSEYSFQGTVYRTAPARRSKSGLPILERMDLGLHDFGPGIKSVNPNARLVAIRSASLLAEEIQLLSEDERAELLASLSTPPADEAPGQDPPDLPPAAEAPDTSTQLIALLEAEAANRRRLQGTPA